MTMPLDFYGSINSRPTCSSGLALRKTPDTGKHCLRSKAITSPVFTHTYHLFLLPPKTICAWIVPPGKHARGEQVAARDRHLSRALVAEDGVMCNRESDCHGGAAARRVDGQGSA